MSRGIQGTGRPSRNMWRTFWIALTFFVTLFGTAIWVCAP